MVANLTAGAQRLAVAAQGVFILPELEMRVARQSDAQATPC
jgi:hypothetical protein